MKAQQNCIDRAIIFSMLSTRKQRAKERRARQADMMSDVENSDVMLGSYSRNELESNSEERNIEVDLERT